MTDPTTIWTKGNSDLKDVPKQDREMLAGLLRSALLKGIGQAGYAVVDQPGPKVMRLRSALTQGEASNVTMDTITTVIPQAFVMSSTIGAATGTAGFAGDASVELELV